MQSNLTRKRMALASADTVVAVSEQIGHDLIARAPELTQTRVEVVPNPFDLASLIATARSGPAPRPGPYALFVGKLEPNKGADLLARTAHDAGLTMPLVVVGDGSLRNTIERDARQLGVDLHVTGWLPRDAALGWMASATFLIFPSRGPESLSRVLVEASALGIPAAAMATGGTREIIVPGHTGLLSSDAAGLANDVRRLAADQSLRARLGAAAVTHARERFDAWRVVARIESIYCELVASARRRQV
jgi:glycosyltransferase involved in cell wall biosynthesis